MVKGYVLKRSFVCALFVLAIFSIVLLIPSGGYAQEKVITLNYSNFFPAPHKNSILSDAWCKEVEKRTNGRVKITYFPGGTLTPAPQTYDNVVKGIADIGFSVFGYSRGKFPMIATMDAPLGYKSGVQATRLVNEFYKKFKPKELDEVQVMYLHAHGPGILHTKKPVAKLEDVKGLKIRAQGTVVPIVQAIGGAPVGASMPETYDALRTGVVDGSMAPYEALEGWKWGEIITSSTECYSIAYTATMFVVMNKNKWNALPPDIQKIIEQINAEWTEKQGNTWDEIDKEGKEFSLKRGNKAIALSAAEGARWKATVQPIMEAYATELKGKGLPGDEALKFCRDYLAKSDQPAAKEAPAKSKVPPKKQAPKK
jgi:TRAP-type C4-dicarboxylate transport system substrate-binding protein